MKIICIGRNYVAHARELNSEVPDEPVFFMKPDSSLLRNNDPFFIPDWTKEVHHEIELVLRISRVGKNIEKQFANRYYDQIGLGVDFTARDLQYELIKKRIALGEVQSLDRAAVISHNFIPVSDFSDPANIRFSLNVNGQTIQTGNSGLMIFPFDDIIAHVSRYITLKIGDLIYTGTPAGVGPVKIGDRLEGFIEDEKMLDFMIK